MRKIFTNVQGLWGHLMRKPQVYHWYKSMFSLRCTIWVHNQPLAIDLAKGKDKSIVPSQVTETHEYISILLPKPMEGLVQLANSYEGSATSRSELECVGVGLTGVIPVMCMQSSTLIQRLVAEGPQ